LLVSRIGIHWRLSLFRLAQARLFKTQESNSPCGATEQER